MNNPDTLSPAKIAALLHEASDSGSVHLQGSREERRAQFRAMREADHDREESHVNKDSHFAR